MLIETLILGALLLVSIAIIGHYWDMPLMNEYQFRRMENHYMGGNHHRYPDYPYPYRRGSSVSFALGLLVASALSLFIYSSPVLESSERATPMKSPKKSLLIDTTRTVYDSLDSIYLQERGF